MNQTEPQQQGTDLRLLLAQADSLCMERRFEEASAIYQNLVVQAEGRLGPNHPNTILVLQRLADSLYAQNLFRECLPLYQRLCAFGRRTLGDADPDVINLIGKIAKTQELIGEFSEAKATFEFAISTATRHLTGDHELTRQLQGRYEVLVERIDENKRAAQAWKENTANHPVIAPPATAPASIQPKAPSQSLPPHMLQSGVTGTDHSGADSFANSVGTATGADPNWQQQQHPHQFQKSPEPQVQSSLPPPAWEKPQDKNLPPPAWSNQQSGQQSPGMVTASPPPVQGSSAPWSAPPATPNPWEQQSSTGPRPAQPANPPAWDGRASSGNVPNPWEAKSQQSQPGQLPAQPEQPSTQPWSGPTAPPAMPAASAPPASNQTQPWNQSPSPGIHSMMEQPMMLPASAPMPSSSEPAGWKTEPISNSPNAQSPWKGEEGAIGAHLLEELRREEVSPSAVSPQMPPGMVPPPGNGGMSSGRFQQQNMGAAGGFPPPGNPSGFSPSGSPAGFPTSGPAPMPAPIPAASPAPSMDMAALAGVPRDQKPGWERPNFNPGGNYSPQAPGSQPPAGGQPLYGSSPPSAEPQPYGGAQALGAPPTLGGPPGGSPQQFGGGGSPQPFGGTQPVGTPQPFQGGPPVANQYATGGFAGQEPRKEWADPYLEHLAAKVADLKAQAQGISPENAQGDPAAFKPMSQEFQDWRDGIAIPVSERADSQEMPRRKTGQIAIEPGTEYGGNENYAEEYDEPVVRKKGPKKEFKTARAVANKSEGMVGTVRAFKEYLIPLAVVVLLIIGGIFLFSQSGPKPVADQAVTTLPGGQKPIDNTEVYTSPDNSLRLSVGTRECSYADGDNSIRVPVVIYDGNWSTCAMQALDSLMERQIWFNHRPEGMVNETGVTLFDKKAPDFKVVEKMEKMAVVANSYYLAKQNYPKDQKEVGYQQTYMYTNPFTGQSGWAFVQQLQEAQGNRNDLVTALKLGSLVAGESPFTRGEIRCYAITAAVGGTLRGVGFFVRGADRNGKFFVVRDTGETMTLGYLEGKDNSNCKILKNAQSNSTTPDKPTKVWIAKNQILPPFIIYHSLPITLGIVAFLSIWRSMMVGLGQDVNNSINKGFRIFGIVTGIACVICAAIQFVMMR